MDQPPADTLPRFASKAAFLAWEEQQETRFEFDGEDVTEVTGGTLNHIRIMFLVNRVLDQRLQGKPFIVLQQVKVETSPGYRYPDVAVGPRGAAGTGLTLPEPLILFEIRSPSTSGIDLGGKRVEYCELPSVRRYVLLESRRIAAIVLTRANGGWVETALEGSHAVLDLGEIGVRVRLGSFYKDVVF